MNKFLLTLLALFFTFSCSSTTKAPVPLTPTQAIAAGEAPWDSLPETERSLYAQSCSAATSIVANITTWPLAPVEEGMDNPEAWEDGYFMSYHVWTEAPEEAAGTLAIVVYRMEESKQVVVLSALFSDEAASFFVEYHIFHGLVTGTITADEEDSNVLFGPATGEFFCTYQE